MLTFLNFLNESANNYGESFEKEFSAALKTYSTYHKNASKNKYMLKLAKILLEKILDNSIENTKKYEFEVVDEAESDKRRNYLIKSDDKNVILNPDINANIGAYITDVTVVNNSQNYYISLKANNTLCFATIGLKTIGLTDNETFSNFLDYLFKSDEYTGKEINQKIKNGINVYFKKHKSKKVKEQHQKSEDKNHIVLHMTSNLKELLKRSIGYGYYYVWFDKSTKKYKIIKMTKELLDKIVNAFNNEVILEFPCETARIAYFKFENPYIKNFRFELKNNHSGKYPDQIKMVYTDFSLKNK